MIFQYGGPFLYDIHWINLCSVTDCRHNSLQHSMGWILILAASVKKCHDSLFLYAFYS